MIRGDASRRRFLPAGELPAVVAVGAVHAQRAGLGHHQRIRPLGLLHRASVHVRRRQLLRDDPSAVTIEIVPQIVRLGRVEPEAVRQRLAHVTGVAGHAGVLHVLRVLAVDLAGHLQHATGDELRVQWLAVRQRIGREVGDVVAVGAVAGAGHPGAHRHHGAVEFTDRDVVQHLHVLPRERPRRRRARRGERGGDLHLRELRLQIAMVVILLHGRSAVPDLNRVRSGIAARPQREHRQGDGRRDEAAVRGCQETHGDFPPAGAAGGFAAAGPAAAGVARESTRVESAGSESAGVIRAVESSIIAGCGATYVGKESGAVP